MKKHQIWINFFLEIIIIKLKLYKTNKLIKKILKFNNSMLNLINKLINQRLNFLFQAS
jgi:hypothetical protein